MDPNTLAFLAADAFSKLGPYWPILATKAAEAVGEKLPGAVGKLWLAIKQKFDQDESAKSALDQLLTDPQNEKLKAVVEWQLEQILAQDSDFATQLKGLVKNAQTSIRVAQTGSGTVVVGDGNKIVGERGVIVNGDVKGDIITGEVNQKKE